MTVSTTATSVRPSEMDQLCCYQLAEHTMRHDQRRRSVDDDAG
jgi:hypothetical protein